MNRLLIVGIALIALAIVAMAASGSWGWSMHGPRGQGTHGPWVGTGNRPGPASMPHMGWGGGPGAGVARPAIAGAPNVPLVMTDFRYIPAEIRVKAGQPVNLELTNRGAVPHDLVIPGLRFHVEVAAGGQTTTGLVAPRAGVYEFYCSELGHRAAGMAGRLIVAP